MDELKENRSPQSDSKDEDLSILMTKKLELIHPLEHQWTFWYLKNQQGKDWNDNLMKLATFGYVEEFWAFVFSSFRIQIFVFCLFSLFNHLRVASRLPASCDYMLFKTPILPCWEDEQNSRGGRWVLYFSKPEQIHLNLDVCWLAAVRFFDFENERKREKNLFFFRCWR